MCLSRTRRAPRWASPGSPATGCTMWGYQWSLVCWQDAARMLHRFIMHDLAWMSMRMQSLAFLSIGHDMLLVVVAGCPFFGSSSLARGFVCWLLRLPLFRQFVLPASSIVGTVVGLQA